MTIYTIGQLNDLLEKYNPASLIVDESTLRFIKKYAPPQENLDGGIFYKETYIKASKIGVLNITQEHPVWM